LRAVSPKRGKRATAGRTPTRAQRVEPRAAGPLLLGLADPLLAARRNPTNCASAQTPPVLVPEAAQLSIRIAKGLLKLAHRVDLVLAEKAAVEAPLALPQAPVAFPPTAEEMIPALRRRLDEEPESLGADRAALEAALDAEAIEAQSLLPFYEKYFPEKALGEVMDLQKAFAKEVRRVRPDWPVDDPSVMAAAYYIAPGEDERRKGYSWRIALNVVDVVAELGAENTARFVRDEGTQKLVQAVLERFGEADVQNEDSWAGVLRVALRTTLNGALDVHGEIAGDDEWVQALLGALDKARKASDAGDNFVMGLLQGRGYPLLVGHVLQEAAGRLRPADAASWETVAADLLAKGGELIQAKPGFKDFFRDHWGDLLRAGLSSVKANGPALFDEESPLLRETLIAVADRLSRTPNVKLLSSDVVFSVTEAALGAVAAHPELVGEGVDEAWLAGLIGSVAKTVSSTGLRKSFTSEGIQVLVGDVLVMYGERPELLVRDSELVQKLVGGVLKKVGQAGQAGTLGTYGAEELAGTAVRGALDAIAANPQLLDFKYPELVVGLAGKVSELVHSKGLSKVQGADLLGAMTQSLAENPGLFLDLERKLAGAVLDAVMRAAEGEQGKLIAGATVVELTQRLLGTFARRGRAVADGTSAASLSQQLTEVLEAGLARAAAELGHRITYSDLAPALAELVAAWLKKEIATLDPEDSKFKAIFAAISEKLAA